MKISVTLTPKTRLQKALQQADVNDPTTVASLAITGRLTDNDIKYIREKMGKTLQELDLSMASFKKNKIPCPCFTNCTGLKSVHFPDTIVEIEYRAFSECIGLTSITIPASVVEIDVSDILFDFWAFAECNGLATIDVHPDNPVFASKDGILYNKEKTELIKCPNGRQGDYLIPETVTYLGRNPFDYSPRLTSITAPPNHTEFSSEDGVLYNKEKTEVIKCPNGWQGDYAIPETVVEIYSPFENCTELTSIFIPASVVEIGWVNELTLKFQPYEALKKEEYVFCTCTSLTSIIVDVNNPLYASEDGILFNKDKTELIVYPKGRQGDYLIPASVVKIRTRAFRWSTGLISVVIPESVTEIGNEAFEGCTALSEVTIPNSVTTIRGSVFKDCIALTSISIPNSVVEIVSNTFCNCTGLASIFIPASVIEISMRHWNDEIEFYKCPAFVTVHPDNHKYKSINGKIAYKNIKAAGRAGELKWRISGKTLTISGNGEIPDYDDDDVFITAKSYAAKVRSPWYIYRKMIRKIVYKGNISMKEGSVFKRPYHLTSVTFENCTVPHFSERPCNVNDIIDRAFQGYTDDDCWHFDSWFSWQIPRMLKQTSMSYCDKQILDRIAFCLSEMERPSGKEDNKKMRKYRENMKNEGFALLCENFEKLKL